jgi:DNA-directed RNA polymerase subunit RPC12/RpoP
VIGSLSRLYECPQCGTKVSRLEEVTSEDIQREKGPPAAWQYMCEECRKKIRSMGQLEPQYNLQQGIRDALVLVPIFSVLLILLAGVVFLVAGHGAGVVSRISFYIGAFTVLVGVAATWDRFKNRYAATHSLRWSLNSRQILIALSVIMAALISSIVSTHVYS